MAYSSRSDVEDRLQALPAEDLVGEQYEKINSRVAAGIEYADGLIDSKLAKRYKVPFSSTPVLIKHISADLAAAFSLDGGFSAGGEDEPTKLANTIRKRAMELLEDLAKGEDLLTGTGVEAPAADVVAVIPTHSQLGQRPALQCFDLYNEPA